MLTREDVRIGTPCGLDFDRMPLDEVARRFCGDCKKHVHDLGLMTETEATALMATASEAQLCVRYVADDRGRLLFIPDVPAHKLNRNRRTMLAAATLAAATMLGGCATQRLGGAISSVDARVPDATQTFHLVRGETKVALTDQPGVVVDEDAPTKLARSSFTSGHCSGTASECEEVRSVLGEAKSLPEYVERLQKIGFSITCQSKAVTPTDPVIY